MSTVLVWVSLSNAVSERALRLGRYGTNGIGVGDVARALNPLAVAVEATFRDVSDVS